MLVLNETIDIPSGLSVDSWLNLGVAGAALLIILITVWLVFRQQAKSVDRLCDKIDKLVSTWSDTSLTLREVTLTSKRDQEEIMRQLDSISRVQQEVVKKVTRIDTRIFEALKKETE